MMETTVLDCQEVRHLSMISAFYSWRILPRILGLPRTPHHLSSISWTTTVRWRLCHSHPDRGVYSSRSICAPCVCLHIVLTWTRQPPKLFCRFPLLCLTTACGENGFLSLWRQHITASWSLREQGISQIKGPVEQPICDTTARLCHRYKRAFTERLWRASSLEYAKVRVSASHRWMLY